MSAAPWKLGLLLIPVTLAVAGISKWKHGRNELAASAGQQITSYRIYAGSLWRIQQFLTIEPKKITADGLAQLRNDKVELNEAIGSALMGNSIARKLGRRDLVVDIPEEILNLPDKIQDFLDKHENTIVPIPMPIN